ncbi:MAG: hypothetical protein AB8H86_22025 [Polyangiales bacterium]
MSAKWKKRVMRGTLAFLALGLVAALGGYWWLRVPVIPSSLPDARARFVQVMNGDSRLEEEAISMLAGAIDAQPDSAEAQLWFGLANLHAYLRLRQRPYAIRASMAFDNAVELDGEDTSAAGWRAFFNYQAARSRGLDLDVARDELMSASENDPRFTPFLAAVSLARMPLSSGYPERVLAPLLAIEDCGDGTSHTCRNSELNPHGAEGYHATVGDLKLRLGDLEGARISYARALTMESAATWPYRDAFESWVQSAESRAASFASGGAGAEVETPVFFASGERACASCHAN